MSNETTDIVYFELNNWFPGKDYPDEEPFNSWLDDDLNQQFENDKWAKENKLCVAVTMVDMSSNYCITATKSWVEENCPKLLTDYTQFLRYPDEDNKAVYGRFDCPFLEYSEENFGTYWFEEEDGNYGGITWIKCED